MSENDSVYSNMHLISAGGLTAAQLFIAARLFDAANEYYGVIILLNSSLLPLWLSFKKPRRIHNLIPMFRQLIVFCLCGLLLSWLLTVIAPQSFLDSTPAFLASLSTFVALCATLPPSIIPFSVALFAVMLIFKHDIPK